MKTCMKKCCSCLPQRYVMAVYLVLGLIICYLMRVCVYLALSEMTFRVPKVHSSNHQYCPADENASDQNSTDTNGRAEFHWDQNMQHYIIMALFVGYIITHVPAGVLADTFGGKQLFGAGILVSSVTSLAYPALARWGGPYAMIVGRLVQGFGQGVMFPTSSALVAKWAPPNERSFMTGIVQTGVMFGNALGFITSGIILNAFPGWEPVFYLCGALGLVWSIGWYTLCYNSPAEHPFISDKERDMITSQLALNAKEKPKHIPWGKILTSGPFISANMINFAHAWALFTMINEMPSYMSKVLNFDVLKSGLFSAAPHLAMVPSSIGIGYLNDYLVKNKIQSITTNRKMFSFFANTLPIPFMIAASFAGCDRVLVILLFMSMMFFKGFSYSTSRANPVDLSPNYAGVLMGIMNGTGAFAGIISPACTPLFITGDGSIEEWRNVFYLAAFVMAFSSLPFLCFGSGEVQRWNSTIEPSTGEQEAGPSPRVSPPDAKKKNVGESSSTPENKKKSAENKKKSVAES